MNFFHFPASYPMQLLRRCGNKPPILGIAFGETESHQQL